MQDTRPLLLEHSEFPPVDRRGISTLQVNLGYLCNMSCNHCHVNAGPSRTEQMGASVANLVLEVLKKRDMNCLDLTGGAPELNQYFRDVVQSARSMGVKVIDRCNLTVLFEDGQQDLADFLAGQRVSIVASLPCYLQDNVESQRGKGAYEKSIAALQLLNGLGYGVDPELELHLVYNPVGSSLPPPQQQLEAEYKSVLGEKFGVAFNRLLTITNMPISRFGAQLLAQNKFSEYMNLLRDNFQRDNLETVMCRDLVSVDWQGYLYDCDFNQMLAMPLGNSRRLASSRAHLRDLLTDDFVGRRVNTADHCYGCTAGQGSSCSGALERTG